MFTTSDQQYCTDYKQRYLLFCGILFLFQNDFFMTLLFLNYVPNNIDSIVNQVVDIEYKQKHGQYVSDKHCQPYLKQLHVNVVHVQKSSDKWTEDTQLLKKQITKQSKQCEILLILYCFVYTMYEIDI